jgi:hypothetical protein
MLLIAVVDKSVEAFDGLNDYVATHSPASTIRAAELDAFFTTKTQAPYTTCA